MKKLGVVLHISGSRKLIMRSKIRAKSGIKVYDEELKSVGRIIDMFGPTRNPYVSVEPTIDEVEQYVGHSLYIME